MLERLLFLSPALLRRPFLACEISPFGVMAARQQGEELTTHYVPLPAQSLAPGLKAPTILNQAAVAAALKTALGAVVEKERKLTVVLPDGAVRVLLIDFDSLPSKAADVLPIIRFRLRKLVPFEVADAAISYQVMPAQVSAAGAPTQTRVLVVVTPREVLDEYESAIRAAGYEPGVVLSSTLAATAVLDAEPALVINRNGTTLTTAIVRGEEILLHRSLDLEPGEEEQPEYIRQTVSVAAAYFEDTLAVPPTSIYYVGPGTAAEFVELLNDAALEVRDLVPTPSLGTKLVPRSLLAPVAGALASS